MKGKRKLATVWQMRDEVFEKKSQLQKAFIKFVSKAFAKLESEKALTKIKKTKLL